MSIINGEMISFILAGVVFSGTILVLIYRPNIGVFISENVKLTALFWIILWNIPYWFLGPNSLIAGHDEIAVGLPLYLNSAKMLANHVYLSGTYGGIDSNLATINSASSYYSLERILFQFLPPWLAILGHKLLISAIAFFGGYLIAESVSNQRIVGIAAGIWSSIAFSMVSTLSLTYGAAFAGIPLAAYVLVVRIHQPDYFRWVILTGFIWSLSYEFVTGIVPAVAGVCFIWLLLHPSRPWRFLVAGTLLTFFLLLNWMDFLYGALQVASSIGRQAKANSSGLIETAVWVWEKFNLLHIPMIITLGVLLYVNWRCFIRVTCVVLLALFSGMAIQSIPFNKLGAGFLEGVNFIYLSFAFPTVFIGVTAIALVQVKSHLPKKTAQAAVYVFLAAGIAAGAGTRIIDTINMIGVGGQQSQFNVPNLVTKNWQKPNPYRAVTVPYVLTPSMTTTYEIDTLDGYAPLIDSRLRNFWGMGVERNDEPDRLRTGGVNFSYAIPFDGMKSFTLDEVADINLLKTANVGYVISRLPVSGNGLVQISGPSESDYVAWYERPKLQRIEQRVKNLFQAPEAFVYEVKGALPRVYLAKFIKQSTSGNKSRQFYDLISRHGPERGAIIARGDETVQQCCGNGEISNVNFTGNSIDLDVTTEAASAVIINVVLNKFWTASVDGKPVQILRANGIQAMIAVPKGQHKVRLDYKRESVWTKLSKLIL